jgi:ABC-type transport system substrate-binding protein
MVASSVSSTWSHSLGQPRANGVRTRSPSPEEAIALYQEAELMLAEDMPAIPLWYGKTIAGYSSNVDNVKIDPFGTTDLLSITLAD